MSALGELRVVRDLAIGGMARLSLADRRGQPVVVKRLLPQLADRPELVQQLLAEGRRMAQLDHVAGVADVLDIIDDGGESRLVLEYIEGLELSRYLDQLIDRGEKTPLGRALSIASLLAATLDEVHRAVDPDGRAMDLVHRDVCPANLIAAPGGRLVLIDFGVAAARWPAGVPALVDQGRAAYMAPEQARGLDLDGRADLYPVGVILFELITGSRLYGSGAKLAVLGQLMDAEGVVARPSDRAPCPDDVEEVIVRALRIDRDQRYSDAAELRADLQACLRRHAADVD